MRRAIKIVAGVVGLAVIVVAGAAAFAQFGSEWKMHRKIAVEVAPIAIPTDADALARGEYLFKSRGCGECHGLDGAGKIVINDGGLFVQAPQVAPGDGGAVADYAAEDWVRIIRHGVKPNGEPAFVMPSEDFARLTDADVGAIVAYVRSMPPVAGMRAEIRIPLLVRFLYAIDLIEDSAQKIDHTLEPAQAPPESDLIAQGAYVAEGCKGCHNAALSGGPIPGAPPAWPPAANLTGGAAHAMSPYRDAAALAAMFRSGKRPDGSAVSTVMPFGALKEMSDADMTALYAYLMMLPAREGGDGA